MKVFVNILTLMRIIAIFLLPILWNFKPFILIIFLVCILLTDFFDGLLARKFHVQTLFGNLLDCIADKLFGIVTLLVLGKYIPLFWILAILESLVACINIFGLNICARVYSVYLGKVKMWLLGFTMIIGMIYIFKHLSFLYVVIGIMISILSIVYLFLIGIYLKRLIIDAKNNKHYKKYKLKRGKDLSYALFNTDFYIKNKEVSLKEQLYNVVKG